MFSQFTSACIHAMADSKTLNKLVCGVFFGARSMRMYS